MAKGREIFVTFEGERTRLASIAKEHGVSAQTAYYRYRKAGRPETVMPSMFAPINEYLKVKLLPDGTMHTPNICAREDVRRQRCHDPRQAGQGKG